ncbi:hypothetical protein [Psychrobacillus phage Perkons]|nr:hypothetical protein [Psychrobacillus phage Perkons]
MNAIELRDNLNELINKGFGEYEIVTETDMGCVELGEPEVGFHVRDYDCSFNSREFYSFEEIEKSKTSNEYHYACLKKNLDKAYQENDVEKVIVI